MYAKTWALMYMVRAALTISFPEIHQESNRVEKEFSHPVSV